MSRWCGISDHTIDRASASAAATVRDRFSLRITVESTSIAMHGCSVAVANSLDTGSGHAASVLSGRTCMEVQTLCAWTTFFLFRA